ncbi:hypothetical protein M885DRAFT_33080 [Pelagophyceae sp. CCMP2097]|nr:hypothetical protein M885DRAFT_33080 [Pelagophyceae sp. CCMP2097]
MTKAASPGSTTRHFWAGLPFRGSGFAARFDHLVYLRLWPLQGGFERPFRGVRSRGAVPGGPFQETVPGGPFQGVRSRGAVPGARRREAGSEGPPGSPLHRGRPKRLWAGFAETRVLPGWSVLADVPFRMANPWKAGFAARRV